MDKSPDKYPPKKELEKELYIEEWLKLIYLRKRVPKSLID